MAFTLYSPLSPRLALETWFQVSCLDQIDGLVQDCSNSSAVAMELMQSAVLH